MHAVARMQWCACNGAHAVACTQWSDMQAARAIHTAGGEHGMHAFQNVEDKNLYNM